MSHIMIQPANIVTIQRYASSALQYVDVTIAEQLRPVHGVLSFVKRNRSFVKIFKICFAE